MFVSGFWIDYTSMIVADSHVLPEELEHLERSPNGMDLDGR